MQHRMIKAAAQQNDDSWCAICDETDGGKRWEKGKKIAGVEDWREIGECAEGASAG